MVRVAAILVGVSLSFGAGWMVNGWRWEAKEADKLRELAEAQAKADKRSYDASVTFEKGKERVRTVFKEIEVEVEKIIDRPVYLQSCLDDGGLQFLGRAIEETAR